MSLARSVPLRRALAAASAASLLLVGLPGHLAAAAPHADGGPDFNGDGYADLVVIEPSASSGAGAVVISYGSAAGLGETQVLHQDVPGAPGVAERDDWFGHSVSHGDFDGDGYSDLAVGVPQEDVGEVVQPEPKGRTGGVKDVGAVVVFYGSPGGLGVDRAEGFNQDTAGVPGVGEYGDAWGFAVEAGDFDGDGRDDLAIAAPYEAIGSTSLAGAVTVLYGSDSGLSTDRAAAFHQNTPGVPGGSERVDLFGATLTHGDFDGDGRDDLAVGVRNETLGDVAAGAVTLLYGSTSGLTADGSQLLHQGSRGVPGANETGDAWGGGLASGDFDGDGHSDLVVGAHGEGVGDVARAGAVTVVFGAPGGLRDADAVMLHQNLPGIPGGIETGDRFGSALAVGDFDGDGRDDLAVGSPTESVGTASRAGMITVLSGSVDGFRQDDADALHRGQQVVPGELASQEGFGGALASGDHDGDGRADLVVGNTVDWTPAIRAGGVTVLHGDPAGLGQGDATRHTIG